MTTSDGYVTLAPKRGFKTPQALQVTILYLVLDHSKANFFRGPKCHSRKYCQLKFHVVNQRQSNSRNPKTLLNESSTGPLFTQSIIQKRILLPHTIENAFKKHAVKTGFFKRLIFNSLLETRTFPSFFISSIFDRVQNTGTNARVFLRGFLIVF